MKRALFLTLVILSVFLNAADDNPDYSNANIHPLEFTACGATEHMHLLDLAAHTSLIEEEKLHVLNLDKKNERNCHSQDAAKIEERTRKAIEAKPDQK